MTRATEQKNEHDTRDELVPVDHDPSRGFYVVLFALVIPVAAITPASWIFIARHLYKYRSFYPQPSSHWFYKTCVWHGYAEILFSLYYAYLTRRIQRHRTYPTPPPGFLRDMMIQIFSTGLPVDKKDHTGGARRPRSTKEDFGSTTPEEARLLREKLRKWFFNARTKDIKRENVREWLAWAIANGRTLEEADAMPEYHKLVDESIAWAEARLHAKYEPGYNKDVKCMRLTLDPVRVLTRPLGYYVVTNAVTIGVGIWLVLYHGFQLRSSHGLQMLVKPASDAPKSDFRLPIVFLHGLGIGLGQYMGPLRHIAHSDRGVVILLQPGISTAIWHPRFLNAPPPKAHSDAIKAICHEYGFEKATILSHSNGTMVHVRSFPSLPS